MENKETKKFLIDDTNYETKFTEKFLRRKKYIKFDPKKICAFIPGIISEIKIKPGEQLKYGNSMLVLEAMKMKNDVLSPLDGKIKVINVTLGQMVTKGQLLIEFE